KYFTETKVNRRDAEYAEVAQRRMEIRSISANIRTTKPTTSSPPPARQATPARPMRSATSTAPPAIRMFGKDYFKNREGKLIELPKDITAAEAAQMEADAVAAEKQLGKGPPPQPVPDVKKLDKKED